MKFCFFVAFVVSTLAISPASARSLTAPQFTALSQTHLAAERIEIGTPPHCDECGRYALEIAEALRIGGWKVSTGQYNPAPVEIAGVTLVVGDKASPPQSANDLATLLTAAGISFGWASYAVNGDWALTDHALGYFFDPPQTTPQGVLIKPGKQVAKTVIIFVGRAP